MGAAFLCGHCGIDAATLTESTSYIAGWLKALQNDTRMVAAVRERGITLRLAAAFPPAPGRGCNRQPYADSLIMPLTLPEATLPRGHPPGSRFGRLGIIW